MLKKNKFLNYLKKTNLIFNRLLALHSSKFKSGQNKERCEGQSFKICLKNFLGC